ncbi:MAG: hypothetical protein JWO03_2202 [Bacteroidetes bacterium]|nr:hypothetical protein [Bacteroidota bacterium]
MKKIILAFSLLAITATTAFAGNSTVPASLTAEQRVNRDIQSQLSVPRMLTETPGEYSAELHFHVNAQGGIVINDIITDNDDLKHSLMLQSRSITVNTEGLNTESSYKMTIRYKIVEHD